MEQSRERHDATIHIFGDIYWLNFPSLIVYTSAWCMAPYRYKSCARFLPKDIDYLPHQWLCAGVWHGVLTGELMQGTALAHWTLTLNTIIQSNTIQYNPIQSNTIYYKRFQNTTRVDLQQWYGFSKGSMYQERFIFIKKKVAGELGRDFVT